jgi:hypothetical protein
MNSTGAQNLLDQGYALFDRDMLALDHVTNFIGHFDCAFVVDTNRARKTASRSSIRRTQAPV